MHKASEKDAGTTGHYRLKVLQQPGINTQQVFIKKALIGYLEVQHRRPQRAVEKLWVNPGCSSELGEQEEELLL